MSANQGITVWTWKSWHKTHIHTSQGHLKSSPQHSRGSQREGTGEDTQHASKAVSEVSSRNHRFHGHVLNALPQAESPGRRLPGIEYPQTYWSVTYHRTRESASERQARVSTPETSPSLTCGDRALQPHPPSCWAPPSEVEVKVWFWSYLSSFYSIEKKDMLVCHAFHNEGIFFIIVFKVTFLNDLIKIS